ncbi:MAG: ATP-binding protein [Nanoarchaeota archaeon]
MRFTILTKFAIIFLTGFIFVVYLSSVAVKDFADVHYFLSEETGRLQADITTGNMRVHEQIAKENIKDRAEWAASQLHDYLLEHKFSSYSEMEKDETLKYIAIRKVGKTGYTAVHDTKGINHFHVNPALVGTDLHALAEKLPEFWKILEKSLAGDAEGFYKWQDADGSIKDKYMYCKHLEEEGLVVCATTYMEEFSMPMNTITNTITKSAEKTQENISIKHEESYVRFFVFIVAMLLLITASLVYVTYTLNPLIKLEKAAKQIAKGNLHVKIREFRSHDEIGELNGSFILMAKKLREATENLEKIISIRTKAPEKKTTALEKSERAAYNMMEDLNESNKKLNEEKRSIEIKVRERTLELQEAYEKLKDLDKAKEEFISMLSHELKTPLFPIMGYVNMVLDGKMGKITHEQKEKFAVVAKCATNLNRLVEDMLDMSKLELKRIKLDIRKEDIASIAKEAVDGLEFMAKNKKLSFALDAPQKVEAECDRKRILQVIDNFITNAIKFTKPKGRIILKVWKDGDKAFASIKDDGIGISLEGQKQLFNRFYQVQKGLQREYGGGTGLGLAISKGIIELHKGKVFIESRPNKGSTFGFSIPVKSSITEKKAAKTIK